VEPCYVSNNAPTAESVFSATSGWPLAVSRRIFARVLAVPVSMGAVAATAVLARPNDAPSLVPLVREDRGWERHTLVANGLENV